MIQQSTVFLVMSIDPLGRADLQIDPQTADRLFRTARSAQAFTDEEVDVAQIEAVYELIKWGPTAMNILPLRLLVLRRGEARERLVPLMNEDRKSTRLNSSHVAMSYAVFCLKKNKKHPCG